MAMALTVWVFPSANTLHSSIARASASAIARASSSSPTISLPAASPPDHDIITTGSWQWKHRCFVHYQYSSSAPHDAPAVLLLPGFGVGSFHFEHQLRGLASQYRVWAMDFLGQGRSWPSHDPAPSPNTASPEDVAPLWGFGPDIEPWAKDLAFSVDLWRDQILNFVDQLAGDRRTSILGRKFFGWVRRSVFYGYLSSSRQRHCASECHTFLGVRSKSCKNSGVCKNCALGWIVSCSSTCQVHHQIRMEAITRSKQHLEAAAIGIC